ncbi:uncharacterized protein LOC100205280 isoform X1 [Hydra vulgaris]|uniref:Uncharacterized protein LOC100205280 isoform X1 n=1 Tax=Hydra vulgaris TaxID=6087 RepID=A0ABM4CFN1_HYDVU
MKLSSQLVKTSFFCRTLTLLRVTIVLCLSCVCTIFCTLSLVYLIAEVDKNLSRLEDCSFNHSNSICSCYITNSEDKQLFRFSDDCQSVKKDLRSLVYGVCVLFGIGCIISITSGISSFCLLFKQESQDEIVEECASPVTQTCVRSLASRSIFNRTIFQKQTELNRISIGTQTPNFLISGSHMVYNSSVDTLNLDFLMHDYVPPPSYNDIVQTISPC